jgi:DNA-binding response OmpR family regulator
MVSVCIRQPAGYRDKHLAIDFEKRQAILNFEKLSLTRKEYELLRALALHAGETVSQMMLLENIWGYQSGTRTRTLDVHICRLRKKLASAGHRYIETVFGVGVRFQSCEDRAETASWPA